jgi:hypothetical protein
MVLDNVASPSTEAGPSNIPVPSYVIPMTSELRAAIPTLSKPSSESTTFLAPFLEPPNVYNDSTLLNDDLFEESLNSMLHKAFKWGESITENNFQGLQPATIEGFADFVEYYVGGRGLSEGYLQGCVDQVMEGLKTWSVTIAALGIYTLMLRYGPGDVHHPHLNRI